jgi:Spy/CpxP family protein refolding chaperone
MKTKVIVIIGFFIAFVAGAVLGLQLRQPAVAHVNVPQREDRSWLRTELGLSPQQEEQMRDIWSNLHNSGRKHDERRRQLRDERDEAIAALLPASAMGDYDKVLAAYSDKMSQLSAERDKGFAEAVEKTKKILTPAQQTKYEEFLKRREGPGPGGPRGDRGPHGPPPGRKPETRPQ